jgi:hypothetical protein
MEYRFVISINWCERDGQQKPSPFQQKYLKMSKVSPRNHTLKQVLGGHTP